MRPFTFPDTFKDAVACWVADFGETLHLKKQAKQICLFDGAEFKVIAQEVLHQDAVVGTKKLVQSGGRDVDAGINAAQEHKMLPRSVLVAGNQPGSRQGKEGFVFSEVGNETSA